MRAQLIFAACLALSPVAAIAGDEIKTYVFDGDADEAAFGVESAIVDRGLVIDYVSHVGDMLERTKADVGGGDTLFTSADVYLFCSAVLSRKVMEADPMNIGHCPYGVFVADDGAAVRIGYRTMPDGAMQEVEALLDAIAREAAGL